MIFHCSTVEPSILFRQRSRGSEGSAEILMHYLGGNVLGIRSRDVNSSY